MDRRTFLRRAGLVSGGAVLGAGAVGAAAEADLHLDLAVSGHAVGPARPSGVQGTRIVYRVPTSKPWVALTFDDGPSSKYTAAVLDILDSKQVVATFNLIGRHVEQFPDLARRAASKHEIGNHTWSHPDLSLSRSTPAREQLQRAAAMITRTVGRAPTTFRPPYGYLSGATMMQAAGMGYPIILWDQLFNRQGESAPANAERLGRDVSAGSIVLGHDGGSLPCDVIVAALPDFIDRIHARGLQFVTISTLLGAPTA